MRGDGVRRITQYNRDYSQELLTDVKQWWVQSKCITASQIKKYAISNNDVDKANIFSLPLVVTDELAIASAAGIVQAL